MRWLGSVIGGGRRCGSTMWWGQSNRDPAKFIGHTIRLSAWVKTENMGGHFRPNMNPRGLNFQRLFKDKLLTPRLTGTTDWTECRVICFVPKDAVSLDAGFTYYGNGTVWIDPQSIKYEIVDDPDHPKPIQ